MQLINTKNGQVLLEFKGRQAIFYNKYLEGQMRMAGIPIPPGMRSLFGGKDIVYLEDSDFQRAFKEVYYFTALDSQLFFWKEI